MENLSTYTKSLIEAFHRIHTKKPAIESEFIEVSKTVSFFALMYERLRNVIEFRDEHLIRRNAINRIVSRRLAFNPTLTDEGFSIAKEIVWAGYHKMDRIPESLVHKLEKTIEWYMALRKELITGEQHKKALFHAEFIRDMLVCQIEELFSMEEFEKERTYLFYMYQVLNPHIVIEGLTEDEKSLLFYVAIERTFLKSDKVYLRYRLFKLLFENLLATPRDKFVERTAEFKKAFAFVDKHIDKPLNRKITNYLRNLRPAYLILREIIFTNKEAVGELLSDEKKLEANVESVTREKYSLTREKLTRAGIRSFIYIFLTKMVFVLIAEYPIMRADEHLNYTALGINALFPPLMMALFVLLTSVPGEENTKRIIERVKEFVYQNEYEPLVFKAKKVKKNNFLFSSLFWSFYFLTFGVTFVLIDEALNYFAFPWYSKIIFFFFVTAVSFFGYRVRMIAKEYVVKQKDSVITPILDFFMVPLIQVGKWLSSEISKINVLIFIFDFLIEAPFKILFEVIEEWIHFVRKRKDEIV